MSSVATLGATFLLLVCATLHKHIRAQLVKKIESQSIWECQLKRKLKKWFVKYRILIGIYNTPKQFCMKMLLLSVQKG
jgi:hypothetical protein